VTAPLLLPCDEVRALLLSHYRGPGSRVVQGVKALPNPAPISSWCALADQAGLHGVAVKAGYEANGGGFNNALGRLRTLELVQGHGAIKASDAG
jgi:hypothetical protein